MPIKTSRRAITPISEIKRQSRDYALSKGHRDSLAADRFNAHKGIVMNALEATATRTPFTGNDVKDAADYERQKKLDKLHDYKTGINAAITAAELGLSGASLLGAYANYRNWATSANIAKQHIANLLQRAQLPMQVSGTLIDGYQTYDALSKENDFDAAYNGVSAGLGTAGSVGASDVFLNSRFHSPKIDRLLDVLGIIQNTGDFVKFGYDALTKRSLERGGK